MVDRALGMHGSADIAAHERKTRPTRNHVTRRRTPAICVYISACIDRYNYTADTNPDSFADEHWRLVMSPERVSKSCASFKLSTLAAIEASQVSHFLLSMGMRADSVVTLDVHPLHDACS